MAGTPLPAIPRRPAHGQAQTLMGADAVKRRSWLGLLQGEPAFRFVGLTVGLPCSRFRTRSLRALTVGSGTNVSISTGSNRYAMPGHGSRTGATTTTPSGLIRLQGTAHLSRSSLPTRCRLRFAGAPRRRRHHFQPKEILVSDGPKPGERLIYVHKSTYCMASSALQGSAGIISKRKSLLISSW